MFNKFSNDFLKKYKNKQPPWGFGALSLTVYKRTYSRIKEDGISEEWWETLVRTIEGAQRIGAKYTIEESEKLFDLMFNLKCSFAGRGLWQLGTKLVDEHKIADSLLNCWVTKVSEIEDFVFIFTESMFGGGVGCNIAREYTQELPRVKEGVKCILKNTKDADFIVPDSKEGWADLWRKILQAYLITGKSFTYSTVCIRTSGEPIKTFGGIAPGPKVLSDGVEELCKVLENRKGKKLRTQDVADIITIGGQVVKSGGVRRTAILLGGDVDDIAYLNLKRWDLGGIPNHRSNSNNSIIVSKYDYILDKFWEGYKGNGEPYGLLNLRNARRYGRTKETEIDGFDLTDSGVIMYNPCAESQLADKEPCCLSELFLNNITSKEEMFDCASLLYKTQKAICAHNYYHEDSNKVVHKNMRIGVGITGIAQKMDVFEEWCDYTYKKLRKFDKQWSKENNYPQSIRLTLVKPSGTLSLLSGSTPGGHPGFSKYHIRRVRFDGKDILLDKLQDAGYRINPELRFDETLNRDLMIVDFPVKFDDNTLLEKDCGTINQLNIVKKLQKCWADQAVSVTTYYRKDEIDDIKKWLKENYDDNVKTLSFLLKTDHGFKQPPLEEITEEEYNNYVSKIKPLDTSDIGNGELQGSLECSDGTCPIK